MDNKRKTYANALYILVCGTFFDFYSWGFLQQYKEMNNNSFLRNCFGSLSRTFSLGTANLFDNSKGVASIRKYLIELRKSNHQEDKDFYKAKTQLLEENKDKLTRLNNRRGNDLAHSNLEVFEEIEKGIPSDQRGKNSKESSITGKEIIEALLLAEKIIKAIVLHELKKKANPQNKIYTVIKKDFEKCFGEEAIYIDKLR